jgi:mannose-6-phosphate isomerase-like protein (cupin superfamily)
MHKEKSSMNSLKIAIAGLVLVIGFLTAITRAQVLDKKALAVDEAQPGGGAAVVKAEKVTVPSSFEGGTTTASSSSSVTYFDSQKVAAGFAHGNPSVLFQGAGYANAKGRASNFEVHTSRIEAPDPPESHTLDTDIYFVLEGTITMVTGGTIVNPKEVRPNQIRGTDIEGGETHQLSKGEVMIIPNGVPHWHKVVPGAFTYLVIKIR